MIQKHLWGILIKGFVCIAIFALTIYFSINRQNTVTELRREIPKLSKEVTRIKETNRRLKYEIDQFESPIHLRELMRSDQYSHLHYPHLDEVILLEGGS